MLSAVPRREDRREIDEYHLSSLILLFWIVYLVNEDTFSSHCFLEFSNIHITYPSLSHFKCFDLFSFRWGFRQVEICLPGTMQFLHVNFVRGDKGRCLMLRSLVKKATPHRNQQQQLALQQQQILLHHANASNNNLMNQLRMGMMPPGMGIGHFGMGFGAPFGMAEAGMMFQQHSMLTQQGQIQQYQNAQMQFQHLMNQGMRLEQQQQQQNQEQQQQQQQQQQCLLQNTVLIGSKDITTSNDDGQTSNDKINL